VSTLFLLGYVGLPGVGLSGLFFIVSALATLPVEVARTIKGKSSPQRWATVLRPLAIAVAMIVALEVAYAVVADVAGFRSAGSNSHPRVPLLVPLAPALSTLAVIVGLLVAAKLAQLLRRRMLRVAPQRKPRSVGAPIRGPMINSVPATPSRPVSNEILPATEKRERIPWIGGRVSASRTRLSAMRMRPMHCRGPTRSAPVATATPDRKPMGPP
jgi:hypothetical protein